jgi:hypothetical protein
MRYNIILGIIIISLSVLISSCKNEKEVKKEKKSEIIASDTVFNSKNPYYIFIQKHNPEALKENQLIYFKEEDIDLDGKKEAIIGIGKSEEDELDYLFLLKNDNKAVKKIYDFDKYKNSVSNVKFVSLQQKKQKYIYLELFREDSEGFVLFELVDNNVKEILYSLPPNGKGSDQLVDNDKDGKYDGYVQLRNYIETLYYSIEANYVFKDNKFKMSKIHVDIDPDYPSTIEEVLLQYISLRSLDFGESKEVKDQLKLICTDENAHVIKWNKEKWGEAYIKNYMGSSDEPKFEMQEDSNTTTVIYMDEDQKEYQLKFELKKSDSKWQITKVELIK